jgi:NitT/TauT family transport system substrate-binding protein
VDFFKKDPARFAELAAPYYGLTPQEVTEIIDTSLAYTTYEEAVAYLGTAGGTGKLHEVFDQVMQLNLDYGAADTRLDAAQEIDNSILTGLWDGVER